MRDKQLETLNTLARIFYASNGYKVEPGYRFDQARHPQERGMFVMACAAYEFLIEKVPVEDLIDED
jgi:hypothetical protein